MFPLRYFTPRYWAARYWPKVGSDIAYTFSDNDETEIADVARRRIGSVQDRREIGDSALRRIR